MKTFKEGSATGPVQGYQQYIPYRSLNENLVNQSPPSKTTDLWNNAFESIDGKPTSIKK